MKRLGATLFFLLLLPVLSFADDVVVVLSSNLGPYQEALSGFSETFAGRATTITLSRQGTTVPASRVRVAFGGKAVLIQETGDQILIYGLAPGVSVNARRGVRAVKIYSTPELSRAVEKFKAIQPGLKHLAILWVSDSLSDYFDGKYTIQIQGVEISAERLDSPEALPDRLRALKGKADALWLLPDPQLITPPAIATLKEFSWSNHIPFYAPTDALVGQGAVASVSPSFRETGRIAAETARRALAGQLDREKIFPEKIQMTINLTAAKATGVQIPDAVVKSADHVVP
jgi:hypothetical protein